jgi:hypothetical protein
MCFSRLLSPSLGAARLGVWCRLLLCLALCGLGSCATIRVTDPAHTATEQFLMSVAASRAIDQLSAETLRDRTVFVESQYLTATTQPALEHSFLLGELRAKLLMSGVRLTDERSKAQIILEVRSGGVGIDRLEYLLGIPATYIPGGSSSTGGYAIATPELAILKSTRQLGFASVAFIAYWSNTGEVVASSGPFIGRTLREDWWILGYGPRTIGSIPPAESGR